MMNDKNFATVLIGTGLCLGLSVGSVLGDVTIWSPLLGCVAAAAAAFCARSADSGRFAIAG
jgi:hypothetical protein